MCAGLGGGAGDWVCVWGAVKSWKWIWYFQCLFINFANVIGQVEAIKDL